jgi:hypothetical protein
MDRIIGAIDAELARLRMARALLGGETNSHKPTKPGRREMSAATRAKMTIADEVDSQLSQSMSSFVAASLPGVLPAWA